MKVLLKLNVTTADLFFSLLWPWQILASEQVIYTWKLQKQVNEMYDIQSFKYTAKCVHLSDSAVLIMSKCSYDLTCVSGVHCPRGLSSTYWLPSESQISHNVPLQIKIFSHYRHDSVVWNYFSAYFIIHHSEKCSEQMKYTLIMYVLIFCYSSFLYTESFFWEKESKFM
jgi:hypothetical protein